ncbi:TAXI family TRAP transporter solute-binding subunit [Saccharothrix algeriensis]|uniref:TAXI family TRAP transporter solute-binding subunit n=1 Tax=Saccharothrix algeriensis TaxID=173560 RepID=A0A8T8HRX9_9PSEU|nr:TAXI family TRAP transporter solute-binding subunit [Saccharothrix algeriensis]MBM7812382.1 TRAP transporter TAXI family solute receptor [Saccharothrix algeriensis]QTR01139.1 TAXI family TRAP transporter solute-binding subunit [Saccharothrix algeriensis]
MRSWKVPAAVLAVVLVAAGCGGKRDAAGSTSGAACEAGEGRITIATGNSGGVYYVVGGGLAKLISEHTALKATAAETGASVQNVQQLVAGDYDVAFSLADTAADAVNGEGAFEGAPQRVRALARLYPNHTQVLVRKSSGIRSIADMRGKRISTGSPKSGTEVIAHRLLAAAGLDPERDVQAQRLDLAKTADGMKDGSLDGLVWSGGLPTAQITDLTTSLGDQVEFLDVTPQLPKLKEVNRVYDEGVIPAAAYGQPADVPTVVVPNVLLVAESFPAGDACAVTRLLFDRKDELEKIHPAARDIVEEQGALTDPVPLHPGSLDAFGN